MKTWLPAPADIRADLLAFTAVRRKPRAGGWTAERQRGFIAALAVTGSVTAAARRVNMTPEGAYILRRQPDASGFSAAWARAQASGSQRLADIAFDRATEGIAVPVFYKGEQVGERRAYNDRLLMFLMRQSGGGDTRIGVCAARPALAQAAPEPSPHGEAAQPADPLRDVAVWLDDVLDRYVAKVRAERRHRLAGEVVAADYTLRQLTHIELILDLGGRSQELIRVYTDGDDAAASPRPQRNAGPLSDLLDERRRAAWAQAGEPPRPTLYLGGELRRSFCVGPGDTQAERERAQREAIATIAAAQAKWEAAATEEGWARFTEMGEG